MHISSTKYRLAEMKYEHLPQVSKFLAQTFVRQNRIWSNIKFDESEAERFMFDKCKELLEWQQEQRDNGVLGKDTFLNFIYLDQKDRMIAVLTGCEMVQHLTKKSNVSYPKFTLLQSYGLRLRQFIKPQDKVSGQTFYGVFVGVSKQFFGTGVIMLLLYDAFHYMHTQGLRTFYGRASHIKTIALAEGYGEHLGKLRVQEIPNQELYMVLTRLYMDPQHYIPNEIKYFLGKSKL